MILNESVFKDLREGKERITEKNWKHKIDKDLAFKLRDILEDDYDTDYEALREVMKDIYDNIHRLIPDMFTEDECESAKEDLDILDTEDYSYYGDEDDDEDPIDVEDSWNYELSNLYDICDTFNIWIPIRSLDECRDTEDKLSEEVQAGDVDHYEILDWLSDHEQSYEDARAHFAPTELYDVPSQDLVDWIMEHELLATDFIDCFKDDLIIESYDKNGNHETCEECGTLLTDAGECPKCDLGDEDLSEAVIMSGEKMSYDYRPAFKKIAEGVDGKFDFMGDLTVENAAIIMNIKRAINKHELGQVLDAMTQSQTCKENNWKAVYSGMIDDNNVRIQFEYKATQALSVNEDFVTKDMPGLIKAAKAAGLTTLSELDAFIKEHEGEDIMKALADKKKSMTESQDDSDKDEYLKTLAQDTYESGQPYSSDDFKLFRRIGREDGFELTQDDFDSYFEYLDEVRSRMNESNSITNELPESIDQFLMDMAQTTNAFDYNDISKFAKRATEEDIKKLKNLRRKWLRDAEMMEDDEVEAFGKKVASIVK